MNIEMNPELTDVNLGLGIPDEKMAFLPPDLREKYQRQKRENELRGIEKEIVEEFAGGYYGNVLPLFLDRLSCADNYVEEAIRSSKLVKETVTAAIHIVFSYKIDIDDSLSLNKAIREVFGNGLDQEPWKEKFLINVRKYPFDFDLLDEWIKTAAKIGIEEDYKNILREKLLEKEERDTISLETFLARGRLGMEIDGDYAARLRNLGDDILKDGQYGYSHAMQIYRTLRDAGHWDNGPRDQMVFVYDENEPKALKDEIINKIGIGAGIIPKPEPKIEVKPKIEQVQKKSRWKFWESLLRK